MKNKLLQKLLRICRVLLIAAFWVSVWHLASAWFDKPLLFPSPLKVLMTLFELMGTKEFYLATGRSLWNVLSGILAAVLSATLLAILTHRSRLLRDLISPIMAVIKATPVASFIILALIFIGSARVPSFITFLIVFPVIWSNVDMGLSKVDPQLREVATVFRIPALRRLRLLLLPTVEPYFVSALRTSLGLAWKAGIAAEIIAMPRGTVGTMIGDAKQYLLTAEMFAWTLTVILLSLVIEYVVAALFRRYGRTARREAPDDAQI